MRFSIFTYIEHCKESERYFSYGPYVREMNLWLKQVKETEIIAPLQKKTPPAFLQAYAHDKLKFTVIPSFNFLTFRNSFSALLKMPVISRKIYLGMERSEHIHLRCPGNVGLLSAILQIFFPSKPKSAKYAGNWDPKAKQPWSYRLQKLILSNTFLTRNMQVLVYGEWPGQSKNILPFLTASFSEKEILEVKEKKFNGPLSFLFIGSLVEGKQPVEAVKLFRQLREKFSEEKDLTMEIYGDGPEKEKLEAYCYNEGLSGIISFIGNRPIEDLKMAYQRSHFVVLPSKSEGWPKALAEGMFFGCIPIATPVSCVPWMVGHGSRGILLQEVGKKSKKKGKRAEDSGQGPKIMKRTSDIETIIALIKDPEEMQRKSRAAKEWSQQYTVEKFEAAIKDVLYNSNNSSSPFGRGQDEG